MIDAVIYSDAEDDFDSPRGWSEVVSPDWLSPSRDMNDSSFAWQMRLTR